jgi:uncharacterized lipoprotein YehR (DUF1307 family)
MNKFNKLFVVLLLLGLVFSLTACSVKKIVDVKSDDLVYHLGDFYYYGKNSAISYLKRLNGRIINIGLEIDVFIDKEFFAYEI